MITSKPPRAASQRLGRGWLRRLISVRRGVQVAVGVALYLAIAHLGISLLWIHPGRLGAQDRPDCGQCDQACYVAQLAPGHNLHASGLANASTHYSCSRCLGCVSACPRGVLSVGLRTGPSTR